MLFDFEGYFISFAFKKKKSMNPPPHTPHDLVFTYVMFMITFILWFMIRHVAHIRGHAQNVGLDLTIVST